MKIELKNFENGRIAEIDLHELNSNYTRAHADKLVTEWAAIHVPDSHKASLYEDHGLVGVGIISQIDAEIKVDADGYTRHPAADTGFRVID